MIAPAGVILAGGLSQRMGGGDKTLLALDDRSILSHVIARFEPQVAGLALNANGEAARFKAHNLPVVPDSFPGFAGPLAGILAAMEWAASQQATHVVTVAADTPFLPPDLVPQLLLACETQNQTIAMVATPNEQGRVLKHPVIAIWPVGLRDDLRLALAGGTRKVMAWADPHGVAEARFGTNPFDPFYNVNTPAELAHAQLLSKGENP